MASLLTLLSLFKAITPGVLESTLNQITPHEPYAISGNAASLHDSLFIVDLHSDSLLWHRDLAQRADRGHMDLPRLQQGNVGLQVFSATTKSPRGQNYEENTGGSDNITSLAFVQSWPIATWTSLYARAIYQADKLQVLVDKNPEDILWVRDKQDFAQLLTARKAGKPTVGAMYLIEGAHPLEGDLANLERLRDRGLHFVGLTHFFDNELGGSLHGVSQGGLTDFGRQVVLRANELNMTVDIAHASPQMVRDVLDLSTRPVILSHGGFKGICDTPRNLEDTLMQQVAAQGGIVGVGYWDGAVCDDTPLGVIKAIRYGIDLIGLDHIALGSDYDGSTTSRFDTAELAVLTQTMLDENFTEAEIRAVMGENMKRFLLEQLPLRHGPTPD